MEANYFIIFYWFCHTSTWIRYGCTRVPNPEPTSHLPPLIIPLNYPLEKTYSALYKGFPGGSDGKESTCNVGDLGLIPRLERCPGEGKGHPLQSSGLENSMDCIVHGVTKSQTWLSNFHFQRNDKNSSNGFKGRLWKRTHKDKTHKIWDNKSIPNICFL